MVYQLAENDIDMTKYKEAVKDCTFMLCYNLCID